MGFVNWYKRMVGREVSKVEKVLIDTGEGIIIGDLLDLQPHGVFIGNAVLATASEMQKGISRPLPNPGKVYIPTARFEILQYLSDSDALGKLKTPQQETT